MIFAAYLFLATLLPVASAMECDTTTEEKIQLTIASEPDKLVKILEGQDLSVFISALINHGYLIGGLNRVERIYIVDAGKRPGFTTDNVWLFFVQDHCLISAIPATKSIIVGLLP